LRILVSYTTHGVDEAVVQSFIASLQLGLKQRFGGKVDHLRIGTQEEPGRDGGPRRAYVLLYDSVPGGTGYLHQLLAQDATTLGDVFKQALEAITRCPCNLEAEKGGCYRCVYQYRQGRAMEQVSRDRDRAVLTELVNATDQLERVPTISEIFINPNFDSALEAQLYRALRQLSGCAGLPTVKLVQDIVNGKSGYPLEAASQRVLGRTTGRTDWHRWRQHRPGRISSSGRAVVIGVHGRALRRLDIPQIPARGRAEAQCPGRQRAVLGVVGDQRRRQGGPRRWAQYGPGIAAHVDERARGRDGPAVAPQGRAAGVLSPRRRPVTDAVEQASCRYGRPGHGSAPQERHLGDLLDGGTSQLARSDPGRSPAARRVAAAARLGAGYLRTACCRVQPGWRRAGLVLPLAGGVRPRTAADRHPLAPLINDGHVDETTRHMHWRWLHLYNTFRP
jgi:hypothetical protein